MARPLDAQSITMICDHMNEDHADAVLGYARTLAGRTDAASARMTGFDSVGMDLAVETDLGPVKLRIPFDHELRDADDARDTLISLARA
jgi:putative heme iron utilization protein